MDAIPSLARPAQAAPARPGAPPLDTRIPALSVVMPAYNEQAVLDRSIAEAVLVLERICADWELVVVDDGSKDDTPRLEKNQGYSRALAHGLRAARFDAVFYTDADAQFDLAEIPRLYERLGGEHEMVVGYREHRQDPRLRLFTSWVFNRLQGLVLGVRPRDVNCAFKLFSRHFLEEVRLESDGFLIDAELFARAKAKGLGWCEVGVTHRPREQGSSTVRASTVGQTLRELWRLKRNLAR
jgi:glycosyltransferase involved in cell wall biosynthesis